MSDNSTADSGTGNRAKSRLAFTVAVFVLVCFLVMNARGVLVDGSTEQVADFLTGQQFEVNRFEHGWPKSWLLSETKIKTGPLPLPGPVVKLQADSIESAAKPRTRTTFFASPMLVRWPILFLNLAVMLLATMAVYAIFRLRQKRHGLSFSLLEFIAGMTIVCVVFADYQFHRNLSGREQAFQVDAGKRSIRLQGHEWHGPSWLRSLVGEQSWMAVYRHANVIEVESLNFDLNHLEQLSSFQRYARKIKIWGDPSVEQIKLLETLSNLEAIEIDSRILQSPFARFSSQSTAELGFYDLSRAIAVRRYREFLRLGEPHNFRLLKSTSLLPSIVELEITSIDSTNHWPRAFDLIGCCPNLESVTLNGYQFVVEDLANLPPTIENINCSFYMTDRELDWLKEAYPSASVKKRNGFDMQMVPIGAAAKADAERNLAWSKAKIRINRCRESGWRNSAFQKGLMDLSFTKIDHKLVEKLSELGPETKTLICGNFDSTETALSLIDECSSLSRLKANGYPFESAELKQFPRSIDVLEVEHYHLGDRDIIELIEYFDLRSLTITSSRFDEKAMSTIREANPNCTVVFESLKY